MRVEVLLFGPEAELAKCSRVCVEVAGEPNCGAVLRAIGEQAPALAEAVRTARLAVNHSFAPREMVLRAGDEVALIGAVGGG